MNPLSSSSLNAERARADAARSAPTPDAAHTPDAASGGFAALLRGAQTPAAPEATAQSLIPKTDALAARLSDTAKPAAAVPPAAAAQDDARTRKPAQPSTQAGAGTSASSAEATEERDDASVQDQDDTATSGDTLAHWLLNQGAYVADAAQAGQGRASGLPPPQNPATASDDLKSSDAVRSRAKAASTAKPGTAAPGAQADDADAARREATGRGAKPGHAEALVPGLQPGVPVETTPATSARHDDAASRFDEQLTAALQAPLPASAAPSLATAAASVAATVAAEQQIDTPVNHPGFGEAVGVTISQLARNGVHEARLQLNPAELGPVSVHIAMNGQEARIELGAAQAQTRAMLDASLPALTEAFRADGLVLAASQVSDWQDPRAGSASLGGQGGAANGQGQSGAHSGAHSGTGGSGASPERGAPVRTGWVGRADSSDVPLPAPASWRGRGLGGLDLYA